jgi:hypothetical protein
VASAGHERAKLSQISAISMVILETISKILNKILRESKRLDMRVNINTFIDCM